MARKITTVCIVALALAAARGAERFSKGSRELMLGAVRASIANDGAIGHSYEGLRNGGVWARMGGNPYFSVGGLWIAAQKRVNGVLQKLVLAAADPFSAESDFVPGSVRDNANIADTTLAEKYRVFSSAFVESPGADPLLTEVWPIRIVNGSPAFVADATKRELYPRYERSDEDVFSWFSDADSSRFQQAGLPLGIEVQQTVSNWRDAPLSGVLVVRDRIANVSRDTLFAPVFGAVYGIAIGDTASPMFGRNNHANIVKNDSVAFVYATSDTESGESFGSIGFVLLNGGQPLFHNWNLASAPSGGARRYDELASPSAIDTNLSPQAIAISAQSTVLLPGDTYTFEYAVVFAGSPAELAAIAANAKGSAHNDFAGLQSSNLGILDAEVSDSITTAAVPGAMVEVEGDSVSFSVAADVSGSARVKIPLNAALQISASAGDYFPVSVFAATYDSLTTVLLQMHPFSTTPVLPVSSAPLQLGDLYARARVILGAHAVPFAGHDLQLFTTSLAAGGHGFAPTSTIRFAIRDASRDTIVAHDSLETGLFACGGIPQTMNVQKTFVLDSAIEFTVSFSGSQLVDSASVSSFAVVGNRSDVALTPVGTGASPEGFSCAPAVGGGAYTISFSPGGTGLFHIGAYIVSVPYLKVNVTRPSGAIVPAGQAGDSLDAGRWTMREAAWLKRAGTFLGYPCADPDTSHCEFFNVYFQSVSLLPFLRDSIVFAHCITLDGNKFGIDFSNKGIPNVYFWRLGSQIPQNDLAAGDSVVLQLSGGTNARFPMDSAVMDFMIPTDVNGVRDASSGAPAEQLSVYPNPFASVLHCIVPAGGSGVLYVEDMLGRIFFARSINAENGSVVIAVPAGTMPPGFYTLVFAGAHGVRRASTVLLR